MIFAVNETCVCAMIHGFTLVCLDIQFILSSSLLPFATNIARSVSFLRSAFGKKIACRIGAEQNCDVARSSRVNNNGTIKKKEALHERQQQPAAGFSAFGDARNASGGILTDMLGSHYGPEQKHSGSEQGLVLFHCQMF